MTFSEFLKILAKYYEPLTPPYYKKNLSGNACPADFVRSIFMAATVGSYDLFPNDSLPGKIYNGTKELSQSKARKVISDLDKENFINFLDSLASEDSRDRLSLDFGITSDDKAILYEHIFNCFIGFIEKAAIKKTISEDIIPSSIEHTYFIETKHDMDLQSLILKIVFQSKPPLLINLVKKENSIT